MILTINITRIELKVSFLDWRIFIVLQVRAVGLNDKNFPIEWPKSFVGDREEAYRPI